MSLFRRSSVVVVSVRKGASPPPRGYTLAMVDRTNVALGNRHVLSAPPGNNAARVRVIEKFRTDFERDVRERGPMCEAVDELAARVLAGEKLALGCWCKPKLCHADLIKRRIDALVKKGSLDV